MINIESITVDVELENNGTFIDIPDWEGVSLGVRSLEFDDYKLAVDQATEKLARKYQGAYIPNKEREIVVGKLLAKHILFGWRGIAPEYTPELANELLGSERGRELAKKVLWAAKQVGRINPHA
jgi:hypothetical protein